MNLHTSIRDHLRSRVDHQRIKEVGPNRAAAEWLLRCGASVKWKDNKVWISEYNKLDGNINQQHVIEEIDATESCIMNVGFIYFDGLKDLKKIKFCKCIYLEDACLYKLSDSEITNSLQELEIVSCGNISDHGIHAVTKFKNLKKLQLFDLPEVKNRTECLDMLKKNLLSCNIDFPETKNSADLY